MKRKSARPEAGDAHQQLEAEHEELLAALERRNAQLHTAAEVSHAASSILDPDLLIQRVVDLARERFDLYYAGLFLVDHTGEWARDPDAGPQPGRWAVLWAGTGEAGRIMLEQGHKLEIGGNSMIGWCVAHQQARIALDVGEEAVRFENPHLPHTRSELALPLTSRGEVVGAMTIQSTQPAAFSEEDITVLQTMADQLANAIANARLFRQAQREIVERQRAEEALRQHTAELQARNEELDAFAHTVAHDLKEPLSVITLSTAILQDYYPKELDEEVQKRLQHISRAAFKISDIIHELLLLAGVRKAEVVPGPLDMARIVAEVRQRLAFVIAEHHAKLILPKTWPTALGYGPWVEEVWVNYISNAIKYGGQPPRVELGTAAQKDGFVRFWVRDNGAGLTPEEQACLFTPFTRLDQLRIRGHGLGLSIVQRIVTRLGGQVDVESQAGQGSTFSFTLPAAAPPRRKTRA